MNVNKLDNFDSYDIISIGLLITFITLSFILIPSNYSIAIIFCIISYLIVFFLSKDKSIPHIYVYTLIIDPLDLFDFNGLKILLFIISILFPIMTHKNLLGSVFRNKKFSRIILLYFLFLFFQLISFFWSSSLTFEYFKENFLSFFGFLVIIPTYFYASRSGIKFFKYVLFVAFISSLFYFLNLIQFLDFIEFRRFMRFSTNYSSSIERVYSADLRQITKLFIYCLPILFFSGFSKKIRLIIFFTGFFTLYTILAAYLRNELFYTVCGALTFFFLLNIKLFKEYKLFYSVIFSFLIFSGFIYFNQDLIENLLAVTVFSFDNFSSANTVDISQFNRLVVQTPILDSLFLENPVFGSGYYSTSYIKTGHHLMLDLPLYASFATLGIVGVFIHITKYLILIREFFKINVTNVINTNHFVIILLITAYFITQISFRNFQINLELGFDWWYIEHAFFIGIYYAYLKRLKFRNYEKTSY